MKAMQWLLIALMIVSCSHPKRDQQGAENKSTLKQVSVILAAKTSYEEKGEAFGSVMPSGSLQVFPRIVGKIIERHVDVGDHVRKNALLFQIIQDIPGMKFEPEKITAPIEGDVTRVMAEVGSRVSPQTPLLEIINRKEIYFRTYVKPDEFELVKNAREYQVILDLNPSESYKAHLDKVYPQADPKTGMMMVRLRLKSDFPVPAGTRGKVLYPKRRVAGFLVPVDAISAEGIHNYIWIVKEGKAHRKRVSPIDYYERQAICKGDLAEGDTVVVSGWNQLNENDSIQITKMLNRL